MASRLLKSDRKAFALLRFEAPQRPTSVPCQLKMHVATKLLPLAYREAENVSTKRRTEDPYEVEHEISKTFRETLTGLSDTQCPSFSRELVLQTNHAPFSAQGLGRN